MFNKQRCVQTSGTTTFWPIIDKFSSFHLRLDFDTAEENKRGVGGAATSSSPSPSPPCLWALLPVHGDSSLSMGFAPCPWGLLPVHGDAATPGARCKESGMLDPGLLVKGWPKPSGAVLSALSQPSHQQGLN